MIFAPGVEFFGDRHEYYYQGKRLSGVTGLISRKLGLKMPQEFVGEHQAEGIHVHQAVQRWIDTGEVASLHPGVTWLIESWPKESLPDGIGALSVHSEMLVSDFRHYASAVDIIVECTDRALILYDIKKGVFKRDYVTLQLSIYKYLIEKYAERQVSRCVCVCLRDKEYYPIIPVDRERVEKLLYF
jgi:hypothetical protein